MKTRNLSEDFFLLTSPYITIKLFINIIFMLFLGLIGFFISLLPHYTVLVYTAVIVPLYPYLWFTVKLSNCNFLQVLIYGFQMFVYIIDPGLPNVFCFFHFFFGFFFYFHTIFLDVLSTPTIINIPSTLWPILNSFSQFIFICFNECNFSTNRYILGFRF